MEVNEALSVQKALDTPDGKILLKLLEKMTKPDVVRLTLTRDGAIDPLALAYGEGKRCVMVQIRAMLKKEIDVKKQEKAEIR